MLEAYFFDMLLFSYYQFHTFANVFYNGRDGKPFAITNLLKTKTARFFIEIVHVCKTTRVKSR